MQLTLTEMAASVISLSLISDMRLTRAASAAEEKHKGCLSAEAVSMVNMRYKGGWECLIYYLITKGVL